MAELAQQVAGARRIKPANLHLTLAFLGATPGERLVCLQEALQALTVPSLTLKLDCLGYWPRPRILWLGTSRTPPALTALVVDLEQRLKGCGFSLERRPFRPHITLARRFSGPVPVVQPPHEFLSWHIDKVTLVESLNKADGVHYQVLGHWPVDMDKD